MERRQLRFHKSAASCLSEILILSLPIKNLGSRSKRVERVNLRLCSGKLKVEINVKDLREVVCKSLDAKMAKSQSRLGQTSKGQHPWKVRDEQGLSRMVTGVREYQEIPL